MHGRRAVLYRMAEWATQDLSGGMTRQQMADAWSREKQIKDGKDMDGGEGYDEELRPRTSWGQDPLEALIAREEETIPGGGEETIPEGEDVDEIRLASLTVRERQIKEAKDEGKTLKEIAADLGLSHKYVRNLSSSVEKKLSRP
jgi:DNA-directed RNA polymerase specialized sigma24 family protein